MDASRKLLVERVAASRYISKSARLRDLLLYLCECVVEGSAELHEQEVGHKVFGRPRDYDTGGDNIVRVDWRLWALAAAAALFAISTAVLPVRAGDAGAGLSQPAGPTVRAFWSQVFHGPPGTDIVLDDAAIALYQELTGRNLALSEYFDRSYIKRVPEAAQASKLDETNAASILMHRYSSYAHPVDTWTGAEPKVYRTSDAAEIREGYVAISLLPNLGGNCNVLIVSATGGSAFNGRGPRG